MRSTFTKEEFEQYRDIMNRVKREKDPQKTPALFAEMNIWIQQKGFDDRIIYKMDKKIKLANEAEKKGISVVKNY
jgi:hypothetical protein